MNGNSIHKLKMKKAANVLSPSKENNCQDLKKCSSKVQSNNFLQEILDYLKLQGIQLPKHIHLNTEKNPEDFQIKLKTANSLTSSTKGSNNEIKNLKVKLSDTEFELKKIQEDFAQFKRTTKMEKDRQAKKWEEAITKLKQGSQQSDEHNDYQRQKMAKEYEQNIQAITSSLHSSYKQEISALKEQNEQKLKELNAKGQSALKELQIEKDIQFKEMHRKMSEEKYNLKSTYEKESHEKALRNKEKLENKEKKFESIYLALQSEKKTEEKMHEKTKVEAQKEKQKIFGELCFERNIKNSLQKQLNEKVQEVKELKSKLHEAKIELQIYKEDVEVQKSESKRVHNSEISDLHSSYEHKITCLLATQRKVVDAFSDKMEKLQVLHQQSAQLEEERLQNLSEKFNERSSKPEDLEEIKKLTDCITKRDEEIKKLNRDLRYRNLEIENKEEVYNKIFKSTTSGRMREDKMRGMPNMDKVLLSINKMDGSMGPKLERDNSWSKENPFRKAQTADIKLFLRAYNKGSSMEKAEKM